jgi:glyceraldehyde 3-phosphate dehydrogenase
MDPKSMVYLLKYDSVHGKFGAKVEHVIEEGIDYLFVAESRIRIFKCKEAAEIPWAHVGVEYVAETSGAYTTTERCLRMYTDICDM